MAFVGHESHPPFIYKRSRNNVRDVRDWTTFTRYLGFGRKPSFQTFDFHTIEHQWWILRYANSKKQNPQRRKPRCIFAQHEVLGEMITSHVRLGSWIIYMHLASSKYGSVEIDETWLRCGKLHLILPSFMLIKQAILVATLGNLSKAANRPELLWSTVLWWERSRDPVVCFLQVT